MRQVINRIESALADGRRPDNRDIDRLIARCTELGANQNAIRLLAEQPCPDLRAIRLLAGG